MTTIAEDKSFGTDFLENIIDWIRSNLEPEDVFSDSQLRDWALNNGFEETEIDYRYVIGRR